VIRAYLVDDEAPALVRLRRMLRATRKVEIVGSCSDPVDAIEELRQKNPHLLFLDIQMPGLSGFDLLAALPQQPLVIFTTAYDQYALEAFEANSIDYLLKPIEPARLDRALLKAERLLAQGGRPLDVPALVAQIASALRTPTGPTWLTRVASRSGERVEIVDLRHVTHFFARDKLTFAATAPRALVVDQTIAELEERLNPSRFVRIHRGLIVNLDHVLDLHAEFGGRMVVRLKDAGRTSLIVSRDRVRTLKERLGL
jgi:two-component system, LytTR family, response regulator